MPRYTRPVIQNQQNRDNCLSYGYAQCRGCYQYLRVLGSMFNIPGQEYHGKAPPSSFNTKCICGEVARFCPLRHSLVYARTHLPGHSHTRPPSWNNLFLNNIKSGLHSTALPEECEAIEIFSRHR